MMGNMKMVVASRKRPVNVSLDPKLIAEAKEFGTNLSQVLEQALHAAHATHRRRKWEQENKAAIEAWNKLVDEDGLWADKYR